MKNIELLMKFNKKQILEKFLELDTEYETWMFQEELFELKKTINVLFKDMDPTIQNFFFPEETRKELEEKYDELAKNQRNEHPGHDASLPES